MKNINKKTCAASLSLDGNARIDPMSFTASHIPVAVASPSSSPIPPPPVSIGWEAERRRASIVSLCGRLSTYRLRSDENDDDRAYLAARLQLAQFIDEAVEDWSLYPDWAWGEVDLVFDVADRVTMEDAAAAAEMRACGRIFDQVSKVVFVAAVILWAGIVLQVLWHGKSVHMAIGTAVIIISVIAALITLACCFAKPDPDTENRESLPASGNSTNPIEAMDVPIWSPK